MTEEKKDKNWTPVIVGAVVGGLLLIVLIVVIVVLVLKKSEHKKVSPSPEPAQTRGESSRPSHEQSH